jgi:2-oxoglutarate dehydrogenase E2 component (dihydrolipoamide succinyltransferase)
VRRLIKEYNIDPSTIEGTGRGGRVTHQDVMNLIASGTVDAGRYADKKPAEVTGGKRSPSAIPSHSVPHSQMRRSIAQHMVQSMSVAPHVTSVFDADLSGVVAHRDANKADFEKRGAKLTYTAYFVAAAVEALKAVPEANSRWYDDRLEIFDDINIGVATALPKGGLIVPVIMKAQDLDLFGIAQQLGDLTERARSGSLDPKDVQHGTFTISNHGVSGSLVAAPIVINQPQVAILGVGKMERRVVAADVQGKEDIVVRPMCYVTLTIDHRVLDGFQANQFLTQFVESTGEVLRMSGILDTVQQQLSPDTVNQISQQLGVDPATTQQAITAALPVVLGGMASHADDPCRGGSNSRRGRQPRLDFSAASGI